MAGFIDSDFGKIFVRFFTKFGDYPTMNGYPFILSRYCSFHKDKQIRELSYRMDKYLFKFYDDKWLINYMFDVGIPRGSMPYGLFKSYIKKPIEEKSDYDFIFKRLQKRYYWTDNELEHNKPMILKVLEDKTKLRKMLDDVGATEKQYKTFGLEIKPIVKINSGGLSRFLK